MLIRVMKKIFVCVNHTEIMARRVNEIFSQEYLYSLRTLLRSIGMMISSNYLKSWATFLEIALNPQRAEARVSQI